MRRNVGFLAVALSLSLVLFYEETRAGDEDCPVRWGGRSSPNMVSDAKDLPSDLASTKPLWELRLGTHQYTIPTIDRGRMFVGTNDSRIDRPGVRTTGGGVLICVEQATGKLIWRLSSPRYFEGMTPPYHFNQWKCGFCSGPVVEGDRVYVVGGRGEILCLDRDGQADGNDGPFLNELEYMEVRSAPGAELGPEDGDIVWKFRLLDPPLRVIPHDVCGSTLLVLGDLVYACTSNGLDDRHHKVPSPLAPSLIVLDKKSGRLVARDGEKIGQRTLHGHWSSPAYGCVDGRSLVFFGGGDGVLYAFEPPEFPTEGSDVQILRKAWSYDCNPPEYRTRDGRPVPYARWNRNSPHGPSEIIGTPVFHKNRVYVAIGQSPLHGVGQGHLSAVDARTGKRVWASKLVDRTLATVSIAGGLLYIVDFSGKLHCFDADSGERFWVHDMGAGAWSASSFVADGKVYASNQDNILFVLKAAKKKDVLSRTRFRSMPITPTAVDGVLYFGTQKRLIAYPGPGAARHAETAESSGE